MPVSGSEQGLRPASRALWVRKLRRRLRRAFFEPLGSRLARDPETVVRVPPLDPELLAAIKLIAPQNAWMDLGEASRAHWERDQNNSCWTEEAVLGPLLQAAPAPARILEIGPGLGRSAVFFSKRRFPQARFDLFDATGAEARYALGGARDDRSFCGNLPALRRCLEFNGMRNHRIIDARASGGRLPRGDAPYDLVYSFFAVGFHWLIDGWLDEILALAREQALCLFTVPNNYLPSPRVAALPHVLLRSVSPLYPWSTVYFLALTPRPRVCLG